MQVDKSKIKSFLEFFKDISMCDACTYQCDGEKCTDHREFSPNQAIAIAIEREITEVMEQ